MIEYFKGTSYSDTVLRIGRLDFVVIAKELKSYHEKVYGINKSKNYIWVQLGTFKLRWRR